MQEYRFDCGAQRLRVVAQVQLLDCAANEKALNSFDGTQNTHLTLTSHRIHSHAILQFVLNFFRIVRKCFDKCLFDAAFATVEFRFDDATKECVHCSNVIDGRIVRWLIKRIARITIELSKNKI